MLAVDNTQEVCDGIGRQSRSDCGKQVESVVGIGQLGVTHRLGAGAAKCAAEVPCLHAWDHRIALAVQYKKRRRITVDIRNR